MMTDELRELAHAIEALAKSNMGIGDWARQTLATNQEQCVILGKIHDQQGEILAEMNIMNGRHVESERHIRVIGSELRQYVQRVERIEEHLGLAPAQG